MTVVPYIFNINQVKLLLIIAAVIRNILCRKWKILILSVFAPWSAIIIYSIQDAMDVKDPLSAYMLAELSWLTMGNRPIFSRIDVKNTYVIGQYHVVLNAIGLILNQFGPFLMTPCSDLLPLAIFISSAMATWFNIGKILYTVAYFPLLIFCSTKAIGIRSINICQNMLVRLGNRKYTSIDNL